jgi:hypothetical protein
LPFLREKHSCVLFENTPVILTHVSLRGGKDQKNGFVQITEPQKVVVKNLLKDIRKGGKHRKKRVHAINQTDWT